MPPPRVFTRRIEGCHCVVALSQVAALAVALSACSNQPQSPSGVTALAPPNVQHSEECSTLGALACTAMSMLSGDATAERHSTCIAYRTGNTRVERCGSVEAKGQTTDAAKAQTTRVGRNLLAWSDNSNNETHFVIERCDQVRLTAKGEKKTAFCSNGWRPIGTVGANVTSYVDNTALVNQTYLYRVKATNNVGSSGYSNEASITTPSR